MDTTLMDVTGISEVTQGDEVILIGQSETASLTDEEMSEQVGTIPYEILCNISKRVPRVYLFSDGSEVALTA